jgi:4-amino-4-deoxy-L-arabinose transferase-like glycosyltransferase
MPGGGTRGGGPGGFGGPGGPGGLLNAAAPGAEVTAKLKAGAASYTWVAAAVGSNNASGYQLATGRPVMAVGGFNGTDPAPTLERFKELVAARKIHYFVGGGSMGMRRAQSGSDAAQRIAEWVQRNFTAVTVGGVTLYDLTAPSS